MLKGKNKTNVKKKRKKMKTWKKVLIVVLLIILSVGGWFFYRVQKNGGGLTGMLATLAGHDENTRKNLGEFRCLILGISTDQDGVDLTDTIIVLSYHPATQKASLLSIPRDTYTGYNPSMATAYEKINAMYSRKHRPDETLEAVNRITGLDIPYYIVVKNEGLRKLVDTIGGVTFNVPIDMDYDDDSQDLYIHLKAGEQLLDGKKAEQLVRFRHNNDYSSYPAEYGDNDTGRMRTQREFILQTMKQTLKPENITKIFELIDIAKENLISNVNFDVAKDYVPYAVEFDTLDMETAVLPGVNTNKNEQGTWVFIHNKQQTQELIEEMFNSKYNIADETGANQKLKIQLINGCGDSNKLDIALHEIRSLGHTVDAVESNGVDKTVIINQKGANAEAVKAIKGTLQSGLIQEDKDDESNYDVKIILGKDYE